MYMESFSVILGKGEVAERVVTGESIIPRFKFHKFIISSLLFQ